jgi:hypothetical protein
LAVDAKPVVATYLVAPFLGEALSTSTPPLDLILPWNLALLAALYGSGALICREIARRYRFGLPGLCLLGAAYGVYEEALIGRSWFDPSFQDTVGVGSYSRVWHTNLLLATHLTAFHVAVSICSSILLVELLFPARRERAWVGGRGLGGAAAALLLVVPVTYEEFPHGPLGPVLAAAGLCVLLAWCAFRVPRRPDQQLAQPPSSRPRFLGLIAFACTAGNFVSVYSLPYTRIPWPLGILLALAPVAAGVILVRRLTARHPDNSNGLRVVTGVLAFFILLDIVVGSGGRYDLIGGALATAVALRWLHRRGRPAPVCGASWTTR